MTADFADWVDEHSQDHRRRLRTAMFVSLAMHAVLLGIFAVSPPALIAPTPEYLSVDLVAAAPPARRVTPSPSPRSAPPATPPAAEPAPAPPAPSAPAPAPPIAEAPVQVLPEETPGRIREAKPEPPKIVAEAKVEPTPKPTPPAPPPRPKKEEVFADDDAAMAALMAELGGDEVSELLESSASQRAEDAANEAESTGAPQRGIEVSPEQLAWDRGVQQQISRRFPDLARYRGRRLVAQVEINVTLSGGILGNPKLIRTSGDLDFDRRAVSAILLAAPFGAPPEAGPRRLNLNSEDR
ncbi:MAG: TonB C-terminal domain-containing protein [Myxococcota bacterium]